MSTGRTYWWAKDSAWWRRERIVELGEEFGPAGPAVIDWLSCEAKAQNEGGTVKSGNRSIARGCFVDVVTVGHVVSRAVTLGLLDDYEESGSRFTCRISGWRSDQDRAAAAVRKAAQRSREAENTEDQPTLVTVGHGESRPVTECPPTGQDRTEEQHPPNPPQAGGRQRDRLAFEERVKAYTVEVLGIIHEDGWHNVKGAIMSGGARTTDDVLAWVGKYRPDVLPNEVAA